MCRANRVANHLIRTRNASRQKLYAIRDIRMIHNRPLAAVWDKTPPPLNSNAPFAIRAAGYLALGTGGRNPPRSRHRVASERVRIVIIQGLTDAFDV
jgi:hypothetical protein